MDLITKVFINHNSMLDSMLWLSMKLFNCITLILIFYLLKTLIDFSHHYIAHKKMLGFEYLSNQY